MRRVFIVTGIIAILLGIAGGVYFFSTRSHSTAENTSLITPVTTDDHIIGNPAAPVLLVEYCDIESPYCKNFQAVMEGVIATYGKGGNVAWVYRHLPLTDQYPGAEDAAEASECAAKLGGADAFFKFIDAVQAADSFDSSGYATAAHSLGIDSGTFATCLSSHASASLIDSEKQNALTAGAEGAPYTVLLIHGQPALPIQGAFSYDQMKQVIDAVLAKLPS